MDSVAFIGLGSIGFHIARHISNKYKVYFFARRPEVIREASFGIYCDSIENLTKTSSVLVLFVGDYDQCRECLLKTDFDHITKVVVGSTISPQDVKRLSDEFPVTIIDAPVSGGVTGAVDATLISMVSGEPEAVGSVLPILSTYSKKIIKVGEESGKAEVLKSVIQLMVGINTVATCEAIAFARSQGLDLDQVYDAVVNSAGYTKVFENRGKTLIAEDYHKRASMQVMRKDLNIVKQLSEIAGTKLYLADVASKLYNDSEGVIPDDLDFTAVFKMYHTE